MLIVERACLAKGMKLCKQGTSLYADFSFFLSLWLIFDWDTVNTSFSFSLSLSRSLSSSPVVSFFTTRHLMLY